jgi:adenosylcobinamide-phosphate synthase
VRRRRGRGATAVRRLQQISLGLALDAVFGDAPLRPHPVALFGSAMARCERKIWRDERIAGVRYAGLATVGAASLGAAVGALPAGDAACTYVATAGRGLWSSARGVGAALEAGDVGQARRLLPALVGRDPQQLDEKEIARAVVESVAENTVDAIVAPAFFGALGGGAAVLAHRAVNTLDAMVGHHDERYERFGWASARLDDLLAYLPARLTGLMVLCLRPAAAKEVWRAVRHDAPAHPSPNAGVAEAAFAGALGLRLGGENRYGERLEARPALGGGVPPGPADIERAIALSQQVMAMLGVVLLVPVAAGHIARRARLRHS